MVKIQFKAEIDFQILSFNYKMDAMFIFILLDWGENHEKHKALRTLWIQMFIIINFYANIYSL